MPVYSDISPIIAVASDNAFCFRYSENIDLLEKMGCRIRYFSPISDRSVPDADGLLLCGGYPELYAEQLSDNKSMLESVKDAVKSGIPTIAECGGFMYLNKAIITNDGKSFRMAGVFDSDAFSTDRLQRFGYITLKSDIYSMICQKNH